jgi:hypothetical protein
MKESEIQKGIIVAGSLNPEKECQDRVRVFDTGGLAPALRATDYKDPPKIAEVTNGSNRNWENGSHDG